MSKNAATDRADTFGGRLELLNEEGVQGDTAYRLAREHLLWRIAQAIEHKRVQEERKETTFSPNWLVMCLDQDWIPFILFSEDPPPNPDTERIKENLALNPDGPQRIRTIERVVRELGFWEWRYLVDRALATTDSGDYRRWFFENPTRSNWLLCEKAYGLWKRNLLAHPEFDNYLKRVQKREEL